MSRTGGSSYTVDAQLMSRPTFCLPTNADKGLCAANYTIAWKAFLKPAPAGGEYSISAVCKGCATGDGPRSVSTIYRVTFGDVYYCSGLHKAYVTCVVMHAEFILLAMGRPVKHGTEQHS